MRGRRRSGWTPTYVPAGALTGLIGVLLGAPAISVVVALGRWKHNVSPWTPPEPRDDQVETPMYQRGTGRMLEHPTRSGSVCVRVGMADPDIRGQRP